MKREILKKFYLLNEEIRNIQSDLIPKKYLEGGFLWFDELHNAFYSLYEEFDPDEYSELEFLQSLMGNKGYHDTATLTPEHKKKYSTKMENEDCIMMSADFYKECGYCFIPLANLEECLDFMEKRDWI